MGSDWSDQFPKKQAAAILVVVIVLGLAATTLLGGQVSRILSTVGASVGSPGEGVPVGDDAGPGDDGEGDGSGGSGEGSGDGSGGSGSGGGSDANTARALDVGRPDLLIIKTGELSIQAAAIGPAVDAATTAIVALGGYTSGSERSGAGEEAQASVTFRIPSDRWESALAAVRGSGEKVLAERTGTADVTGEVVDLHARIRNLRTTEAAFESIMIRAGTIKDILSVQSELTSVRGEIEQLEARVADLEERAALSTLTVHVRVRPAPAVAQQEARFDPGGETEAATAQLVSILQALATAAIWFAIVWLPVLLALAFVTVVGLLTARWVRRRTARAYS
jgi:uncharacterized protein DUF4349